MDNVEKLIEEDLYHQEALNIIYDLYYEQTESEREWRDLVYEVIIRGIIDDIAQALKECESNGYSLEEQKELIKLTMLEEEQDEN